MFKGGITVANCECKEKMVLQKKMISREDEPGAYCGMITNTTYEITYQCKDCKREWTETKVESKFE